MILLAFRHGLRASELCSLRWDMLDLQGRYHVTRRKNGRPSVHSLRGTEIRALRRLQREQVPASIYVFTTERRTPRVRRQCARRIASSCGESMTWRSRPPLPSRTWMVIRALSMSPTWSPTTSETRRPAA